MAYDGIGKTENLFRTAVVLFELEHLALEIFRKVDHIVGFRAAPAVNTLVLVADDENISVLSRKDLYKQILHEVRILKLVHVNVAELAAVVFSRLGVVFQELVRLCEKIVEIERIVLFHFRLVAAIDLPEKLRLVVVTQIRNILLRRKRLVFSVGNDVRRALAHLVDLLRFGFVKTAASVLGKLFYDPFEDIILFLFSVNGKACLITELVRMTTKYARAHRVKGGHPNIVRATYHIFETLLHLVRRFVRKGYRKYIPRLYALLLYEIGYAVRQKSRLSASRACRNEYGAVCREYGGDLPVVERA